MTRTRALGLTGVSHDGIQKLEAGRRQAQPRTVRKLAEALGVEPTEITKGVEDAS